MMMTTKHFRLTCVAAATLVLAACGGGDDGPARGALLDPAATVATLTAAQIDAATASSGLQAVSGTAKCDVKVVALNYATIGAKGEDGQNASGVMLVPAGACANDSAPLVAYARGTNALKTRTLANPQDAETFSLLAILAAQGYAVVATDYLGYAKSTYAYHPYLDADSQASTVIDSVRAARNAASTVGAKLSGKVMFTGYSQGGHASAAAQRAAERDNASEINVAGGAHLAGPYNLSAALVLPTPTAGSQLFLPFIVTAWQHAYGNIYAKASDAFQPPYDTSLETAFPTTDVNGLYAKLRMDLPATAALDLIMQPAFLAATRAKGSNPLYQASVKNSYVGTWTPKAPVLLCGGKGDPVVPPALHQDVLMADFAARGVNSVTSVDVDAYIQAAYGPGGLAPTDPASAEFVTYYGSYHGSYEQPFCVAAARQFFDTRR